MAEAPAQQPCYLRYCTEAPVRRAHFFEAGCDDARATDSNYCHRRLPLHMALVVERSSCTWPGNLLLSIFYSSHLICVGWVSPSLGGYPGVWPHFLSSQSNLEGVWECWGFDLLVLRPFHFRTSVTFPNPVQCHPLEL